MRAFRSSLLCAAACFIPLALLAGCAGKSESESAIVRTDAPPFAEAAAKYNETVARLGRLWGRAAVQLRYTDDEGERRLEQGEGFLMVELPGRLALSIGKLGETYFWLGGNETRYWWFDLSGKTRRAWIGTHDGAGSTRGGLSASVRPRDLIRLLGIQPLDAEGLGATQWSSDGKLLGVVTPLGDSGRRQRLWLDPETYRPVKIELYNTKGQAALVADLSEPEYVTIAGDGRAKPVMSGKIFIGHASTGAEVRLYLSGLEDGADRIKPAAFSFEDLCKVLRVEDITDLDAAASESNAPATDPANR